MKIYFYHQTQKKESFFKEMIEEIFGLEPKTEITET